MFDERLPADLERIEQELTSLMQFDVEAKFGNRIASAVRRELLRERKAARWKFALALAAGALVWIHLSYYAASVTDFHFRGPARSMDGRVVGPLVRPHSPTDSPLF